MHTAEDKFVCHAFLCEPSSGALCKTIEAACKVDSVIKFSFLHQTDHTICFLSNETASYDTKNVWMPIRKTVYHPNRVRRAKVSAQH